MRGCRSKIVVVAVPQPVWFAVKKSAMAVGPMFAATTPIIRSAIAATRKVEGLILAIRSPPLFYCFFPNYLNGSVFLWKKYFFC